MNVPQVTNRQLMELIKTYWQWRALWISTTFAFALLGLAYVLFLKSDVWVASQGLMVRDEANGASMRLGRFQSQTEMKTAQETILEMARNSQVLKAALSKVGREPSMLGILKSNAAPTTAEVEGLAKDGIEVRAPRGAELGTTEVIYLDIKQKSRERAVALNKAVCNSLEDQLQAVRRDRADGVISELTAANRAAEEALAEATDRLQLIEAEAGADLADLRGLTDTNSGGSTSRQLLDSIKSEMRKVELERHQLVIDMNLAKESFQNPEALLLTPSRLVSNQPGLKKLREGLADASLATSGLKGRFTEANPVVIAALETEDRIRTQLRAELGLAIETLAKDIEVTDQQLAKLGSQQTQLEARLAKLAEIRAVYSNVASDVRARNTHLQEIQRELAQATASRDAAETSSLLTRLNEPMLGERPLGPGRSTILAGATVAGLFLGLGIVFLLTPLDTQMNYGRRKQDYETTRDRRNGETPLAAPTATPADDISAPGRDQLPNDFSVICDRPPSVSARMTPAEDSIVSREKRPEFNARERRPAEAKPVVLSTQLDTTYANSLPNATSS